MEGIALHLHAELHDVRATDAGVAFTAGGQTRRADVLVGADGVHSALRTGHFGHSGPRPLGYTAWRGTLPASDLPRSMPRDATGLWLAPDAHLVHYPVHGGANINVVAIARTRDPSPAPPRHTFGAATRPLIEAVPHWLLWPLLAVDATRPWARGRVVLVGDAAHAMAPSAAQGGAQAIEDAWSLAHHLAARGDDLAGALLAYEQSRQPRVERVAREARRNLIVYGLGGVPSVARNVLLGSLPASLLLARLDWLYSRKPE
jgi:salicylate hydroxylase